MKVDLGDILPVLSGWVLCVDECGEDCVCCVDLDDAELDERVRVAIALYLCAYRSRRYQLVAATHLYAWRNRIALDPALLARAKKVARVSLRIAEQDVEWEVAYWRGLCYAQALIDLEKPVLVKVVPPRDRRERERLRILLEGKRVSIKGRTYHVGGLIRKLNGARLAPWIYLVPKKHVGILTKTLGTNIVVTAPTTAIVIDASSPDRQPGTTSH